MSNARYVTVDELLLLSEALTAAVSAGYGPSFKNTLVVSSTGKLLVTNSGLRILRSLAVDHPCARLIVECARRHHELTGDNTKSFVIFLNEMLRLARRFAEPQFGGGPPDGLRRRLSIELGQAAADVLPELLGKLHADSAVIYTTRNAADFKEGLLNIVRGSLSCHLLEYDVLSLSALIRDYLLEWTADARRLTQILDVVTRNFNILCVQNCNKPAASSRIVDGMLLSRPRCCFPATRRRHPVRFLVMSCNIEACEDAGSNVSLILDALPDTVSRAFAVRTERVKQFLGQCVRAGVDLIVTTSVLTDLEKHQCQSHGVGFIHAVPEDEAQLLATLTAVPLVHDVAEYLLHGLLPTALAQAADCVDFSLCGYGYSNLLGLRTSACEVRTLIVCGPTEGLCQQLYEVVRDTLKCVRNSIVVESDHSRCHANGAAAEPERRGRGGISEPGTAELGICAFPVGGTFEVAMHHLITQYLASSGDGHTERHCTALRLLAEALLSIPRALHDNAYSFSKPRWPTTLLDMKASCAAGSVEGVHASTGSSTKLCALHPFQSKQLLLFHVIALVRQLLKTDFVLPAGEQSDGLH